MASNMLMNWRIDSQDAKTGRFTLKTTHTRGKSECTAVQLVVDTDQEDQTGSPFKSVSETVANQRLIRQTKQEVEASEGYLWKNLWI